MLSTILGLILLVLVPAEAVWRSRERRPPRPKLARYRTTIVKAASLLGFLLLTAYTSGMSASDLGLGFDLQTPGLIGFAISTVVCSGLIISTLLAKAPAPGAQANDTDIFKPEGPVELTHFIFLVLLIGFAWEVLYRGFLLWWLVPMVGTILAVILAGLSYGLAHGWEDSRKGVASIISALLFSTAFALTGSLWWLILIHVTLPIVGFLAIRKQAPKPERDELGEAGALGQPANEPPA